MTVVQLHKAAPCEDLIETLRSIADDLEKGSGPDWPVTTAVLVLGHSARKPAGEDEVMEETRWRTYGIGPRADVFTCRGLLASVIHRGFDSSDD